MPLSPGQILHQRYRIVKLLGQGGFGAVYRAWDTNLNGPCAVKENLDTEASAQKQFGREASLLFNLRHPGLPRVFDAFSLPGQGQYLVMDFVEGQDLQELLVERGGRLPESLALPWIEQVCQALEYLHSQNPPVIHRDIKPANIKITTEGRAMLVDFGIAKLYDPQRSTTAAARAVTTGYSPPEQYGQGRTDARSDVYALGATLYTLLTGQTPPDSVDVLTRLTPPPRPVAELVPEVSQRTSQAVEAAMQVDRDRRTSSVAAFRQALLAPPVQAVSTAPLSSRPYAAASPAAAVVAKQRRPPWGWLALTGALAVAVIVFLVMALGGGFGALLGTPIPDTQIAAARLGTAASPQGSGAPATQPVAPGAQPRTALMALVPAGEFLMGSEAGESDESPVHAVYLDAFYIDLYEVTNRQYADFLNARGNRDEFGGTGYDAGAADARLTETGGVWQVDSGYADHPVTHVTWYGARAFCELAGKRLPTEAEWEKAARGMLQGALYPWGDEAPACEPGAANGAQWGYCAGSDTAPVGAFKPHGYGLYDMAGNVFEWVADWYAAEYYAISPRENPQGPESSGFRVMRGGSWISGEHYLRVADRHKFDPGLTNNIIGFRCARDP